MKNIRILIADDHTLVREGIAAMLKHYDDVEVIGEASDGKEAIDKTVEIKPDIVIMDIAMPGLGGLEATLEIRKRCPDVKILILSQYDDIEYIHRFLKAGVSGYILKSAIGDELISALRAISKGQCYLYPKIASSLVDGYLGKKNVAIDTAYEKITDREKQVLKLIAEGNSHKEIANILNISTKTVVAHQTNISERLNIHSRAGLIKFAIKQGIIKID